MQGRLGRGRRKPVAGGSPRRSNRVMSKRCKISIRNGKREVSHLSLRIDEPEIELEEPMALLYLHGFGSSQAGEKSDFFRQRAVRFGLTFCSFDFQGHGESGGKMLDLTLSRNLEDVRRVHEVLRARGHRRVIILGSSMGGLVGLWYSAMYPEELVAGLHVAPALGLENGLTAWAGQDGLQQWQQSGKLRVDNEFGSWDLGWRFMEDLLSYDDERLLELYRTPCLLLQGQQDDRVDWATVQEFAAQCPFRDIEFHLFADGDHRLLDRRERIWDLMVTFLRGRGLLARTA